MQHIRCSLVHIVIAIFFITASCGDEVVVPTSGAAGKVVSIEGLVTATRAGKARTLKDNDVIYVEDTVTTAEGASVQIVLTHNNVLWSLGGEFKIESEVKTSMAWRASKQEESVFAKRAELGTAVAATDTVKTGADTADTVMARAKATPAVAAQVAAPGGPSVEAGALDNPDAPSDKGGTVTENTVVNEPIRDQERNFQDKKLDEDKPKPRRPKRVRRKPKTPKSTGGDGGDDGDDPLSLDGNHNRNHTPTREIAPAGAASQPNPTKSWMSRIANACHKETGGKGELTYKVEIQNDKVVSIKAEGQGLSELAKCIKKKVGSKAQGMTSAADSLSFKETAP